MDSLKTVSLQLDHISIESENPAALAEFYSVAMKMDVEPINEGSWICSAPERTLLISEGRSKNLKFSTFRCESSSALDRLRRKMEAKDIEMLPTISPLQQSGSDFSVKDPDGNLLCFTARKAGVNKQQQLEARLQHVVVATEEIERMLSFYQDVIGFRLSDRVEDEDGNLKVVFLRGDSEHHCFAIFSASSKRMDHHCYETGGWDQIRGWADRLAEHNIPIVWGPGRHGPGHNLFFMINDIDGNWIEFSADLEVLKTDRPVGVWEHTEKTLNQWGKGKLRT